MVPTKSTISGKKKTERTRRAFYGHRSSALPAARAFPNSRRRGSRIAPSSVPMREERPSCPVSEAAPFDRHRTYRPGPPLGVRWLRRIFREGTNVQGSFGDLVSVQCPIWGFFITPRKGSIQYEQHFWLECNRLIANCISTCWRAMRAVAARRGISETGFRCRMATLQLCGRNEFRKQPEARQCGRNRSGLAEIRIETDTALAARSWIEPFRGVMRKPPVWGK